MRKILLDQRLGLKRGSGVSRWDQVDGYQFPRIPTLIVTLMLHLNWTLMLISLILSVSLFRWISLGTNPDADRKVDNTDALLKAVLDPY